MKEKKYTAEGGIILDDEMIEAMAEPWDRGEIPGRFGDFVSGPGKPRIADEEMKLVAFRVPMSILRAVDSKAEAKGENRSQLLRKAVIREIMEA